MKRAVLLSPTLFFVYLISHDEHMKFIIFFANIFHASRRRLFFSCIFLFNCVSCSLLSITWTFSHFNFRLTFYRRREKNENSSPRVRVSSRKCFVVVKWMWFDFNSFRWRCVACLSLSHFFSSMCAVRLAGDFFFHWFWWHKKYIPVGIQHLSKTWSGKFHWTTTFSPRARFKMNFCHSIENMLTSSPPPPHHRRQAIRQFSHSWKMSSSRHCTPYHKCETTQRLIISQLTRVLHSTIFILFEWFFFSSFSFSLPVVACFISCLKYIEAIIYSAGGS